MKLADKLFILSILTFFCTVLFVLNPIKLSAADSERVRAKIGIQIQKVSSGKSERAKSKENLKAGDSIRIYVHTENSCYVYIIHTDGKNVDLLNITEQKIQSATLILPSAQAFYEIDGKSSIEKFAIICSPEQIQELSNMEKQNMVYDKWISFESELKKKSSILDNKENEDPFLINGNVASIAGNVRGIAASIKNSSGTNDDPFLKELQIFSGHGLVIKSYEFKISK